MLISRMEERLLVPVEFGQPSKNMNSTESKVQWIGIFLSQASLSRHKRKRGWTHNTNVNHWWWRVEGMKSVYSFDRLKPQAILYQERRHKKKWQQRRQEHREDWRTSSFCVSSLSFSSHSFLKTESRVSVGIKQCSACDPWLRRILTEQYHLQCYLQYILLVSFFATTKGRLVTWNRKSQSWDLCHSCLRSSLSHECTLIVFQVSKGYSVKILVSKWGLERMFQTRRW